MKHLTLTLALAAVIAVGPVSSRAAAGTCEEAVVTECETTTCPAFCKSLPDADQASCNASCTAADRCKLTLFGGQDRSDQVELDVQKREQLVSCLAENRDAIVVPEELGKPILTEDSVTTTEDTAEVKRNSIRDRKMKKKNWKKVTTKSYAARKKGKKRINPVVPVEETTTTTKPKKKKAK